MDTSLSGTKQKKKKKPARKESHPESKDSLQANKSQPGLQQAKVQPIQITVTKKQSTEGNENSTHPIAKVVLSKVLPQQPAHNPPQEVQFAEGSVGQKKKKKKKKKKQPKQQLEHQAVESVPDKPVETHESGCCKLRNLKEITCFELICPHSIKPAGKPLSSEGPNAEAAASPSPKPSQPATATNVLTQNHLDSLSDAIVKSLASLDKSSISITLVNPKDESTVGEKIVRALQEPSPSPNREIVVDICGTSVIDFGKKDSGVSCSVVSQNSGGKMPSGEGVGSKKSGKKNKDNIVTVKAVNNHVVISGDKHPQKVDEKAAKVIQKQADVKLGGVPLAQPKKEIDSAAPRNALTNDTAQGGAGEKTKAQLKAERKAAFEAENAARLAAQKSEGNAVGEKSKAELKAQRRALQEAQRAAKAAEKPSKAAEQAPTTAKQVAAEGASHHPVSKKADGEGKQEPAPHSQEAPAKKVVRKPATEGKQHEVLRLFSHLHQNPGTVDHLKPYGLSGSSIHPAVFRTGLQIAEGVVIGSNARCVAMLAAFRSLIEDYTCDASKRVSQDLRERLDKNIEFLNKARPLSMSMQNAMTFLKAQISEIQDAEPVEKVKDSLVEWIKKFVYEEICLAKRQITVEAQQKIMNEDVILTYCCSSLVKSVLKVAHESGKNFRVIVVDSRPQFRGREMLEYLSSIGINCTYVLITAVSYIMKEVTKVVLGASTLLANGYVMGHIGTSQIALVAKSRNVPVLVCCETYKFSDRVITDSFALNELGPTSQLVSSLPASVKTDGLKDLPSLSFLNLMYDVTAPQFVDMVITEKGILPCTSVPVVLRMRNAVYQ
uniref:Translation initiation factor eIF2B subunit delta n=1 Tax=Rhipicephalus microplus TaxID=6941 RepID=A0A6M2CVJ4_RHIMP